MIYFDITSISLLSNKVKNENHSLFDSKTSLIILQMTEGGKR